MLQPQFPETKPFQTFWNNFDGQMWIVRRLAVVTGHIVVVFKTFQKNPHLSGWLPGKKFFLVYFVACPVTNLSKVNTPIANTFNMRLKLRSANVLLKRNILWKKRENSKVCRVPLSSCHLVLSHFEVSCTDPQKMNLDARYL